MTPKTSSLQSWSVASRLKVDSENYLTTSGGERSTSKDYLFQGTGVWLLRKCDARGLFDSVVYWLFFGLFKRMFLLESITVSWIWTISHEALKCLIPNRWWCLRLLWNCKETETHWKRYDMKQAGRFHSLAHDFPNHFLLLDCWYLVLCHAFSTMLICVLLSCEGGIKPICCFSHVICNCKVT